MARTTPELVGTIVAVTAGADLTSFVDTASLLVTDVVVAGSPDYSDEKLELIERWLAAHFYVVNDPRTAQEGVSGVQEQFEVVKVDLGLNVTKYGQQAMRLDTDGNLAALENAMTKVQKPLPGGGHTSASYWLGTPRT